MRHLVVILCIFKVFFLYFIDQVEVEDVQDQEKGRNEKKDENGKRKDYPQSKRVIYQVCQFLIFIFVFFMKMFVE